jgi:hypothetical protein
VNYNVGLCFLSLSAYLDFTNKEAEKRSGKKRRKKEAEKLSMLITVSTALNAE